MTNSDSAVWLKANNKYYFVDVGTDALEGDLVLVGKNGVASASTVCKKNAENSDYVIGKILAVGDAHLFRE